jgi:phosphate transport system permease protein
MTNGTTIRRYEIARSTRMADRAMHHFIKVGGIGILTAVLAIFVFILWQILPLFSQARVRMDRSWPLPPGDYVALGADEWSALPFLLDRDGVLHFVRTSETNSIDRRPIPMPDGQAATAFSYHAKRQEIAVGTSDGAVFVAEIGYRAVFDSGRRTVEVDVRTQPPIQLGAAGHPVLLLDYDGSGGQRLAAVAQKIDGRPRVFATLVTQRRTLVGGGAWSVARTYDLSDHLSGDPVRLLVNQRADSLVMVLSDGIIKYFAREGAELNLRQAWRPFPEEEGALAIVDFLFGDDSLVVANRRGENHIFSLYEHGAQGRLFGRTKELPPFGATPVSYSKSLRNKAFLIAGERTASLRYATTESIRWTGDLPFDVQRAFIGLKYDGMWFLDRDNHLHRLAFDDPHPESSVKAFFGKIWYEGAPEPKYEWQSTGATDDFEPKLSMVPLLIGTLKGTLYAMLFSVPLALLAALYTSQFAHPDFRRFIKPTMEIMASLPSVILGFLAALWLAPLVEQRVPSFFLILLALPATAILFGALWNRMPYRVRRHIRPGYEFLYIVPLLALAAYGAWILGPFVESRLFVARDAATGAAIADFRLWWVQATGLAFEQRNSLVVGFMMGFAVIPIIFTITEDSLSNVPAAFRSASLALGASRWQTAVRVVLPTASAGIFSAIMIGFGRAVGETMIVLMATGNTPIMDFNIFSGMRTLSANIAVELPEAPHHSTLYRALFLGAMLLFLMTFLVNTLAELLRHQLREKYKAI